MTTKDNPALDAFRARFSRSPDINEFTPFGFFEAGWRAGGGDSSDAEIIEVLLPDQEQRREIRELRAEIERLRAALDLVKDWRAVGELTETKMAQIQQALDSPKDG